VAEINAVVHAALTALADARVANFCDSTTESDQMAMIGDHGTCEEGARVLGRSVGARARQQWRDLKVVGLDGDDDRVSLAPEHLAPRNAVVFGGGFDVRRVHDRWLLDLRE
jgi:hypothetical protein